MMQKVLKNIFLATMLSVIGLSASAQVKLQQDTLQCFVVGFSAGLLSPSDALSFSTGGFDGGRMVDLYKAPYLNFAIECDYKYKSNWMATFDADIWFGYNSNNLRDREIRMGDIFTSQGYVMSWGGYDGAMTFYNRGLSARAGVAKILPVNKNNPNSGIMLKASGGWFMQKTVFVQDFNESPIPQLSGSYTKLYDHLRNGIILTESLGFWFMSNTHTYVNFKLSFDISQCFSFPSRDYTIDKLMGLSGKDGNRYFDFLYGLKLTWMFPLTGKTVYDYYFY